MEFNPNKSLWINTKLNSSHLELNKYEFYKANNKILLPSMDILSDFCFGSVLWNKIHIFQIFWEEGQATGKWRAFAKTVSISMDVQLCMFVVFLS